MTSASSNVAKMIEKELAQRMALEGGIVLGGKRKSIKKRAIGSKKRSASGLVGAAKSRSKRSKKGGDTVYSSRIPAVGGFSGGRKSKKASSSSSAADGRKKRGKIVAKIMKEKCMSLGEASHYVKANGLY